VPYDESLEQIPDTNHVGDPCESSMEAEIRGLRSLCKFSGV